MDFPRAMLGLLLRLLSNSSSLSFPPHFPAALSPKLKGGKAALFPGRTLEPATVGERTPERTELFLLKILFPIRGNQFTTVVLILFRDLEAFKDRAKTLGATQDKGKNVPTCLPIHIHSFSWVPGKAFWEAQRMPALGEGGYSSLASQYLGA